MSAELVISMQRGHHVGFFHGSEGQQTGADISPWKSASIVGVAEGNFDGYKVGLQALGDLSDAITSSLQHCLP